MSSVKIYTAVTEDLSPLIQGEGFCTDVVRYSDYADLEAKCAALAAKGMELAAEAAAVYGKYNETQMPDRDLVDMQTIQEVHDLCSGVKNADSFLAEVRAQGADECVRKLVISDDDDFSDAPNVCAMVAHQFRQDANTAELVAAGIITRVGE